MSLSDKSECIGDEENQELVFYFKDVKEFIRKLKKGLHVTQKDDGLMKIDYINETLPRIIDKIAGDKLI